MTWERRWVGGSKYPVVFEALRVNISRASLRVYLCLSIILTIMT
jgi:hypothetical protein